MSTDLADKPGTSTRVRSTGGVRRREEDVEFITEGADGHCPGSQGVTGDEAVQGERLLRRECAVERELTIQKDIVRACAVCLTLMFAIFTVRTVDRLMDCDSNDNTTKAHCDKLALERDQLKNELYQFKRDRNGEEAALCSVACPTGWQKFGCSCYHRSKEEKTWDQSREQCQKEHAGDLVIINSEEEQVYVKQLTSANLHSDASWIGLKKTKRGWMWVDGTPTTGYWVDVPLNDRTDSEDMNCAAYFHSKGAWSHLLCSYKRSWICEKPLITV